MQKYQKTNEPKKKVPLIHLSSDQEDESSDERQNKDCRNFIANTSNTIKQSYQSNLFTEKSKNIFYAPICHNSNKQNQLQFSTLSLNDGSLADFDSHVRSLTCDNANLMKENSDLKRINEQLVTKIQNLQEDVYTLNNNHRSCQQHLNKSFEQIDQIKSKYKRLQDDFRKAQKKYENQLINQELPVKKNGLQQISKIYDEVIEKIKTICSRFIEDLSTQKMNTKVQNIIQNYIGQLLQINPKSGNKNVFSEYNSTKMDSIITPNRNPRFNSIKTSINENSIISNDYKLLQKSIEKLKNMEKEIESSSGSFLKNKQIEDNSSLYKSIGLDQSSISVQDKSKSRRKRIFQ